jgi:hypothetical protein
MKERASGSITHYVDISLKRSLSSGTGIEPVIFLWTKVSTDPLLTTLHLASVFLSGPWSIQMRADQVSLSISFVMERDML